MFKTAEVVEFVQISWRFPNSAHQSCVRGQSLEKLVDMGKLNAALLRYLTKDEFRVLTAVSFYSL